MTDAKVLSSPPTSGSIAEVHFESTGNSTWVQFTDNNWEEWCGVFGQGTVATTSAALIGANGKCFVIARGQGYLIDINSRQLLHKTENDWLVSAVLIPGKDVFLACDWTNLFAYSPQGLLWKSQRVSADGIKFTEANEFQVRGQVWDFEKWIDFVLDIEEWNYRSEFICNF